MGTNLQLLKNAVKKASLCIAIFGVSITQSQTTYIFTNASATGSLGPTQNQINTAYASTNLNGLVISNNGIQSWTVPVTGPYKLTTCGAQGAGNGGLGAQMEGDFTLTAGQVLTIVVGQQGINGTGGSAINNGGGGGGGSFIVAGTNSLLIAAGGGGGGLSGAVGGNGLTTTSGGSTYFGGCGNNGDGGHSGITNGDAAGGGGFATNGQNSFNIAQSPCEGGKTFLNGANGGQSGTNGSYYGGSGGFGGGGSGWHNSINRCGGGGGYSGGQGGTLNSVTSGPGGGGGSYNSGNNQLNLAGINSGNGIVKITFLYGVTIAQTSNILCNNLATAVLSASATGGSLPYTYTWLPNGGNSSTTNGLSAGVYTLIVMDNNYLFTSKTFTVTQPLPIVITASTNNSAVCSGNSVILNGGGANTYSWTGGVTNGIAFVPTASGSYTVSGTSTQGCVGNAVITVTVNALPSLTLSASANTMCTNGSPIILSGLPSGGNYTGEHTNGNIFTPITDGTFLPAYNYSDSNTGCGNSVTTPILIKACTGIIASQKNSSNLKLYPNPSSGVFHIETNTNDSKIITVLDVTGRTIITENTIEENSTIDISNLAIGIYYVSIKTASGTEVIKAVKD